MEWKKIRLTFGSDSNRHPIIYGIPKHISISHITEDKWAALFNFYTEEIEFVNLDYVETIREAIGEKNVKDNIKE